MSDQCGKRSRSKPDRAGSATTGSPSNNAAIPDTTGSVPDAAGDVTGDVTVDVTADVALDPVEPDAPDTGDVVTADVELGLDPPAVVVGFDEPVTDDPLSEGTVSDDAATVEAETPSVPAPGDTLSDTDVSDTSSATSTDASPATTVGAPSGAESGPAAVQPAASSASRPTLVSRPDHDVARRRPCSGPFTAMGGP